LRRDNGKTSTIDGDSKAVTQGADGIVTTAAIGDDHNGAQEQNDPAGGIAHRFSLWLSSRPLRFYHDPLPSLHYGDYFRPSSFSICRAILSLILAPQVE